MNKQMLSNYRSYYFRRFTQICFRVLSIFIPVRKNRILISSFGGKQYTCNPKYIVEYLDQAENGQFEVIVSIVDPGIKKWIPRWMKTAKQYSLCFCYYYLSAKVIIVNDSPSLIIPTKKKQLLINTWHGGGTYKRVGKTKDNDYTKEFAHKNRLYCNKATSAYISSSELFTKYHIQDSYEYDGKILKTGMPRNDVFFYDNDKQQRIKDKVYQWLNLQITQRIILYAPTLHDNSFLNNISDNYKVDKHEDYWLDVRKLEDAAHERFGGDWVVVLRAHIGLKSFIENTLDASNYPDMQELLVASEILISDYSSSIWDFSYTYKPCFLYCYDLEKYDQDRGFYIPIHEWGFPVCETFVALLNAIRDFDEKDFHAKMEHHHERLGGYEDGHACERVANFIQEQIR